MAQAVTNDPSAAAFPRSSGAGEFPQVRPRLDLPALRPAAGEAPALSHASSEDFQKFVREQVEKANRQAESLNLSYRYGIRELSGDFFVQVVDSGRNQVLRTIPAEFLLDLHERLMQGLGLLVDEQA